jgi:hypothetical protein
MKCSAVRRRSLLERLQLAKDCGDSLRHGLIDVHGSLGDRAGGGGVHDVEERMDDLVDAIPELAERLNHVGVQNLVDRTDASWSSTIDNVGRADRRAQLRRKPELL